MEEKKSKQTGKFFKVLPVLIFAATVLWFFITLLRGVMSYRTFPPIDLDTKEKVEYMVEDVFGIKDTNNIGSYTVSFHEGIMAIVLNDVKDIHDLCFENLLRFGVTEEDYNEIVRMPFDERDFVSSYAKLKSYEGTWPEMYRKGVKFRDASDSYCILVYEADDILYCEVSTGWDYDTYKKLRSME